MLENFLYAGLRDNRINDGVREFCLREHMDEEFFRVSVNRSIRMAKLTASKPKNEIASTISTGMEANEMQANEMQASPL